MSNSVHQLTWSDDQQHWWTLVKTTQDRECFDWCWCLLAIVCILLNRQASISTNWEIFKTLKKIEKHWSSLDILIGNIHTLHTYTRADVSVINRIYSSANSRKRAFIHLSWDTSDSVCLAMCVFVSSNASLVAT